MYIDNKRWFVVDFVCTQAYSGISKFILDTDSLSNLLDALDNLTAYAGHPDDHFIEVVTAKKGKSCPNKVLLLQC